MPGSGERQRVQFVGQGEDDMEVVGVEQIALLTSSHRRRACAWHLGQQRDRQEL